jgi:hypothetical protein
MASMKMTRSIFYPLMALCISATLPAVAMAGKESRKPVDPVTGTTAQCKQSVRPMTESVPLRRGECVKVRRILM